MGKTLLNTFIFILLSAWPSVVLTAECFDDLNALPPRWTLEATEITSALGIDLTSLKIRWFGNHGWANVSENPKVAKFFDAQFTALYLTGEAAKPQPGMFVIQRRNQVKFKPFQIPAAAGRAPLASNWLATFCEFAGAAEFRCIGRPSDLEPMSNLQKKFDFAGRYGSLLVPSSTYPPMTSHEDGAIHSLDFLRAIVKTIDRPGLRVAVVGTGGGYEAFGLYWSGVPMELVASDIDASAVLVAQTNARLHGLENRIHFQTSDLLGAVEGDFDRLFFLPPRAITRAKLDGLLAELPRDEQGGRAKFYDTTHYDIDGRILGRFLDTAAARLRPGGKIVVLTAEEFRPRLEAGYTVNPLTPPRPWQVHQVEGEGHYQVFELTARP